MIIDLEKFIQNERPYWKELETTLDLLEKAPDSKMKLADIQRFHYLYQRASADLAKITTFSVEKELKLYLESIVGRAFGEVHESRKRAYNINIVFWFFYTLPSTFRRHIRAFWVCLSIMLVGGVFGSAMIAIDPYAKKILLPFSHLQIDPSERVEEEESADSDRLKSAKSAFSSYLMTHNTKVSIFSLALGMTWGIGTFLLLFYNGAILGAITLDYVQAGETEFLLGWLLPHGSIEIPAILVASQAGLVLAGALIGWGKSLTLRARLRQISGDLVTLISGVAIFLIWAGIIEAFLSQYHEPVIPYEVKIGFGMIELFLLIVFLGRSGRHSRSRIHGSEI